MLFRKQPIPKGYISPLFGERRGDLLAHAHELVEALDYSRTTSAKS